MKNKNINAVLRLFKAFVGNSSSNVNEEAVTYGLLIPDTADSDVVDAAIEIYGKDGVLINQTFHKDFNIVAELNKETLLIQQIMHYFTTYGFEILDIFDNNTVYIPAEKLDIPEITDDIKMTFIKAISENELSEKLNALLMSGVALSEQSVKDILDLADFIDKNNIDNIKNREVKTALYDIYNIVPKDPDEFLRYLIYKLINSTLKIKNEDTFYCLKRSDRDLALSLINKYLSHKNGLDKLSSVFLRNKMLFLALKGDNKELNHIINRLRKHADKNHKPLPVNCLDSLTYKDYDKEAIVKALDNATIFREIRILNALRLYNADPAFLGYKIRNGKMFLTEYNQEKNLSKTIDIITEHLANRIRDKFNGKVFCIDDNVDLALPISEKQFCGEYPEGTAIIIPKYNNLVFGVHWFNLDDQRIDLDLHLRNSIGDEYGWDSSYRNNNRTVLFSGDMTDAPKPDGASEMYFINKKNTDIYNISLNDFNYNGKVEYTFVAASADDIESIKNYTVDPNKIILQYKDAIESKNNNIGILVPYQHRFKLILSKSGLGNFQTVKADLADKALEFQLDSFQTAMTLNELIRKCGGVIVNSPTYISTVIDKYGDEKEIELPVDYDLSIGNISKETLISLFTD